MSIQSKWIRRFQVELCSSEGNNVVFKVTSTLFPQGSPEAATEIVVYKHLSDFIRLHASLSALHSTLFPSKEFPRISSGLILEPSSMEERRSQSLHLLEYSSQIPSLYNSDIFSSFTMSNSSANEDEVVECPSPLLEGARGPPSISSEDDTNKLSSSTSPSLEEVLFLAESSEEKAQISESVSHYKKAIKKLLDRAKFLKDDNPHASKGLSKRASRYLQKVETLIKKPDKRKRESMEEDASSKEGVGRCVPYSDLFGDVKDLNRYKVRAVLAERNILASDTRRGNMKVVLKTLQKSSIVLKSCKTSLLPINIRFMVKLICYYETDDFIYLVLENVRHGRIYDLIGYLFSTPYALLESNHQGGDNGGRSFVQLVDPGEETYSEDELTRVELRENSLFCLDKDGIEDISLVNDDDEENNEFDNPPHIEVGEEVLGPTFINFRRETHPLRHHHSRKSYYESPSFLYDTFPHLSTPESLLSLSLLRKWTFQMCQVLFGLHARNIIVKDLNPDNLLLDESCDLKLTYQCQWVSVDKPLSPEALEGGYVAPELHYVEPLTPTCDWWSVGVILFELSSGVTFSEAYPSGLLSHTPILYPNQISHLVDEDLKDFVVQLVQPIPHLRLGAGTEGPANIKGHPFLKMYDLKRSCN